MHDEPRESLLPLPPQGEWDGDRHVHPYVNDPHPDASAPGFFTANGEPFTQEDRSRQSRLTFHIIEEMLGALTPLGMANLIQALMSRLYTPAIADVLAEHGKTPEELDPRNEILPFEALHADRLRAIYEAVEAIVATCPSCGRHHGDDCPDGMQPGAYVHAATGDSVRVWRVEQTKVRCMAQVDGSGREVERVYEREWFIEHFVAADSVEVLPSP